MNPLDKIARLTVEIEPKMLGMTGVAAVDRAMASLQKGNARQVAQAKMLADTQAKEADRAAKAQITAQDRVVSATNRAAQLRLRYEQASTDGMVRQAERYELAWTQATARVTKLQADAARAQSRLSTAQAGLPTTAAALTAAERRARYGAAASMVGNGLLFTGAAGTIFGAATLRSAMGWQTYTSQNIANSPMSARTASQFESLALRLATQTGADPQQIFLALRYGSELGMNPGIDKRSLQASLMLGLPTGGSSAIAPTQQAIGTVMRNFPSLAGNPMAIANMILAASQNSAGVNAASFVGAIPKLLNIAGHIGGQDQFQQALAATAALTSAGMPLDEAQTQITNLISKILKPSPTTSKWATAFDKANGTNLSGDLGYKALNQKGLIGVIDSIAQMHLDPSMLAHLFPNMRGYFGALGLTGNQNASFTNILGRVNGAPSSNPIETNWTRYLGRASTQAAKLQQQLHVLEITVGQDLLPPFNSFLKNELIPGVKDISSFIEQNKGLIDGFIKLSPLILAAGVAFKGYNVYTNLASSASGKLVASMLGLGQQSVATTGEIDTVAAAQQGLGAKTAATTAETDAAALSMQSLGEKSAISGELDTTAASIRGIGAASAAASAEALGTETVLVGGEVTAGTGIIGLVTAMLLLTTFTGNGKSGGIQSGSPLNIFDSWLKGQYKKLGLAPNSGGADFPGAANYKGVGNGWGITLPAHSGQGVNPNYGLFGLRFKPGDAFTNNRVSPTTSGIYDPRTGQWSTGAYHWDFGNAANPNQQFGLPQLGGHNKYTVYVVDFSKSPDKNVAGLGLSEIVVLPNGQELLFAHLSKADIPGNAQRYRQTVGPPGPNGAMVAKFTSQGGPMGVTGNENGQYHLHVAASQGAAQFLANVDPTAFVGLPKAGGGGTASLTPWEKQHWGAIVSAAQAAGVPVSAMLAVLDRESSGGMNPRAGQNVMQVTMPAAKQLGYDHVPRTWQESLKMGAEYLAYLQSGKLFKRDQGSWWYTFYDYNGNPATQHAYANAAVATMNRDAGVNFGAGGAGYTQYANPTASSSGPQYSTADIQSAFGQIVAPYRNPDGSINFRRMPPQARQAADNLLRLLDKANLTTLGGTLNKDVAAGLIPKGVADQIYRTAAGKDRAWQSDPEKQYNAQHIAKQKAKTPAYWSSYWTSLKNKQQHELDVILNSNPAYRNPDGSINFKAMPPQVRRYVDWLIGQMAKSDFYVTQADARASLPANMQGPVIAAALSTEHRAWSNPEAYFNGLHPGTSATGASSGAQAWHIIGKNCEAAMHALKPAKTTAHHTGTLVTAAAAHTKLFTDMRQSLWNLEKILGGHRVGASKPVNPRMLGVSQQNMPGR